MKLLIVLKWFTNILCSIYYYSLVGVLLLKEVNNLVSSSTFSSSSIISVPDGLLVELNLMISLKISSAESLWSYLLIGSFSFNS